MKIGDKVKFEDPFNNTIFGKIVDKKQPKCKCKGMSKWVIDFGEYGVNEVKENDKRLFLHNLEPNKNSLGFNFNE